MSIYVFSGKIIPERAAVDVSPPVKLQLRAEEADLAFGAVVTIGVSQVAAVVNTTSAQVDLSTLKNYVEDLVRVIVDAAGYLTGRGYDVEITSVVDSEGRQQVFGVGIPSLEKTQNERPLKFQDVLPLAMKSEHLRRALGDLREAIRSPVDTGFFCYRAVESIMQHFRKEEDRDDKGPGWERMREVLRIDRSWIEYLKGKADLQRHGLTPYMSGENRSIAMQHAWKVVDRFCVYAHGGYIPPDKKEYPLLCQEP
jgi:hypothetical protein